LPLKNEYFFFFDRAVTIIPKTDLKIYRFDKDLNRFYFFYKREKGKEFPLPAGIYEIEGLFEEKKYFFNSKIPEPEKKNKISKTLLFITKNPNKASIDVIRKKIYIDKDIFQAPEPVRLAILLHELGHYYYYNERKCDLFSAIEMRKAGFPKSIISAAFLSALYSDFRKKHIYKKIKNL
jgi:hypothetical protein